MCHAIQTKEIPKLMCHVIQVCGTSWVNPERTRRPVWKTWCGSRDTFDMKEIMGAVEVPDETVRHELIPPKMGDLNLHTYCLIWSYCQE